MKKKQNKTCQCNSELPDIPNECSPSFQTTGMEVANELLSGYTESSISQKDFEKAMSQLPPPSCFNGDKYYVHIIESKCRYVFEKRTIYAYLGKTGTALTTWHLSNVNVIIKPGTVRYTK